MKCESCNSDRILTVSGKCSDLCFVTFGKHEHDGYVPYDLGIGGGDDLSFNLCMDCGRVQGNFPILDVNFSE